MLGTYICICMKGVIRENFETKEIKLNYELLGDFRPRFLRNEMKLCACDFKGRSQRISGVRRNPPPPYAKYFFIPFTFIPLYLSLLFSFLRK